MNNSTFVNSLPYKIVSTSDNNYFCALNIWENCRYTIFITINQHFVDDTYHFYNVLNTLINDGVFDDSILLGEDYFVSQSYAKDKGIESGIMPDMYFDGYIFNDAIYTYTSVDFSYLSKLNELANLSYTVDDIKVFYQIFASTILKYANMDNINFQLSTNNIYKKCLEYLANYKNDDTLLNLNLLLNSTYTVNASSTSSCSCNSVSSDSTINNSNLTCADVYVRSLTTYITTLFGSASFYKEWCMNEDSTPNEVLLNSLIALLKALKNSPFNINSIQKTGTQLICDCSVLDNISCATTNTINQYLKVLNIVKKNKIDENTNKIKIYGSAFGTLLPSLDFSTN